MSSNPTTSDTIGKCEVTPALDIHLRWRPERIELFNESGRCAIDGRTLRRGMYHYVCSKSSSVWGMTGEAPRGFNQGGGAVKFHIPRTAR